jgi:hypothetical protein
MDCLYIIIGLAVLLLVLAKPAKEVFIEMFEEEI